MSALLGLAAKTALIASVALSPAHGRGHAIQPDRNGMIPVTALPRDTTPDRYTVRQHDTLSGIAKHLHTPGGWDSIYAANRWLKDPNVLTVGKTLRIPDHRMYRRYVPPAPPVTAPAASSAPSSAAPSGSAPAATYTGSSSMEQCIISRESGGDPNVMNSSGHYGLYQFDYQTWVANGGSPATFGHASAAEQHQVFANTVANSGYSAWTPYDGC